MPEPDPAASPTRIRRDILRDAALIVLLGLLLCAPRMRSLWAPDEARYAEVAREMHVTGDYLIPRVYGEPETSYPPLYYWLISLLSLAGVTPLGAMLPSLAAGLGTALLTYAIGRVLWDRRSALLSALILTTMPGFVGPAILCRADTTMAFFELAALFFFVRWYRERESSTLSLAFYGSLAAATLAKGPQAPVIVVGIVLVFLAARRELGLLKRLRVLPGLAILLALTLPWYVWAWKSTGQDYFLGESLSGFVGTMVEGGHRRHSLFTYLLVIPLRSLPWFFFVPSALLLLRRDDASGTAAFLISWIGVVFVFYSLAAAKRHYYVAAIYPALALPLGRFWFLPASPALRRVPLLATAGLAVLVDVALLVAPGRFESSDPESFRLGIHALTVATIAMAAAGLVMFNRTRIGLLIAAPLGGLALIAHVGSMAFYELPLSRRDNADGRRFVAGLRLAVRPEDRLYLYRDDIPSVPLHLDRDCRVLATPAALQAKAASGEPFVVGVKEWWLPEAQEILGSSRIVFRQAIPAGGATLIFLRAGP